VDSNFNAYWSGLGVVASQLPNPRTISIAIIVIGAIMFVFGFAGCCGACKESRCLLTIYIFLMLLVMVIQVAFVIVAFVFRAKIPDILNDSLASTVITQINGDYKSVSDKTAFNLFFLSLQYDAQCCGANGYADYFNKSLYQNNTYQLANTNCSLVPITCCKVKSSGKLWSEINPDDIQDNTCCTGGVGVQTGRYEKGCYQQISDTIQAFIVPIGIVLICFAIFQIVIMLSAFCLCNAIGQQESRYE
jgi:hypothetical protein